MTGRTVDEWIGSSPDSAIPPRVMVRVYDRAQGRCQICTRKILTGDKWQADHIIALINGGQNRESNLQCVCAWCHAEKTKSDVSEKSEIYEKRLKHLGLDNRKSRGKWGWR